MPRVRDFLDTGILSAPFAAVTTTERDGHVMPALPLEQTPAVLARHGVPLKRTWREYQHQCNSRHQSHRGASPQIVSRRS